MAAFLVAVGFDQASKYFLPSSLNDSGAFSLPLTNESLLIGGIFTLILLGLYVLHHLHTTLYFIPTTLVLAGGVSNLLDRLWWGGVRDIFTIGTLSFNLADLYVVGGVGWTLIILFLYGKVKKK